MLWTGASTCHKTVKQGGAKLAWPWHEDFGHILAVQTKHTNRFELNIEMKVGAA